MFGRKLTISYTAINKRSKPTKLIPKLILSGDWILNSGFKIGEKVSIEIQKNKLIITKNEE